MLDDLVFKGKNLNEALAKASNFFGAQASDLSYQKVDDAPDGEIWIKLTEFPESQTTFEENDVQPEVDPQAQKLGMIHSRRPYPDKKPKQQSRTRKARPQERKGKQHDRNNWNQRNQKQPQIKVESLGQDEKEAYKLVADILKHAKLRINIDVLQDQSRAVFNLDGPDRDILVAKKGAVLTSIQYLVNKIIYNKREKPQKIFIDSLGYRVFREEELREIALLSAAKVRSTKKEYVLNPMNPYERRLIHLALKDEDDIITESRGDGFIKQVTIIPK
ncbi:MAG TPA: R3H domain-containing nucleic acid-binding protein [Acidobacteriota bacterium]|nr:R3H domain-containing nucleic acid-binding protein [Acidobacteriota bacterium]